MNRLTYLIPLTIPVAIATTVLPLPAVTPDAALVTGATGRDVLLEVPGRRSEPIVPRRTQLRSYSENLLLPGRTRSTATLTGILDDRNVGPTAILGSRSTDTRYRFPCTVSGAEGFIGWRAGRERDDRGCEPAGVRIRGASGSGSKSLLKAQIPDFLLNQVQVEYCSAIGTAGVSWAVSSSDSLGILGSGDPCERAMKDCVESSSGSDCTVVSTWNWQGSDRDLTALLECADDQRFSFQGTGWVIASTALLKLRETAKAIGAKSCTFDVLAADELIVVPATRDLTLIRFHVDGNRRVVDVIQGSVKIKSSNAPEGRIIQPGFSYGSGREESVSPLNQAELSKSDLVQSFLTESVGPNSPDGLANLTNNTDLSQALIREIINQNQEFQTVLSNLLQSPNRGPQ